MMFIIRMNSWLFLFFFQAEDGIRYVAVTGVQTCALPISYLEDPASRTDRLGRGVVAEGLAREQPSALGEVCKERRCHGIRSRSSRRALARKPDRQGAQRDHKRTDGPHDPTPSCRATDPGFASWCPDSEEVAGSPAASGPAH